jgi:phospholipase/carboxylesterase
MLGLLLLALVACDAPARTTASASAATAAPVPAAPALEAAGIEYVVRHAAGAPAEAELPLVVAIHGFGDRPESFAQVLGGYPRPARLVFPRGIDRHGGGFSWFPIDPRAPDADGVEEGVRAATQRLAAAIAALRDRYPTRGKPIVTGFSQGGMLSFAIAVAHPDLVALAVPVAGWLPPGLWPGPAPEGAPPIVGLHGDADAILRLEPTREAVRALRNAGWPAELVEYPGVGHHVDAAMQRELFRRIVAAADGGTH